MVKLPKNPIEVAEMMFRKMAQEEKGVYKSIFQALEKLDQDFPLVTANHHRVDLGNEAMEFALANLLYSSHAAFCYPDQPLYNRKSALDTIQLLANVPGGRVLMMGFLYDLFPQAVICVEHLFFLQRQVHRIFDLPDEDRPETFRGEKREHWVFPDKTIELLRVAAIDLWKIEEDNKHADEAGK